MTANKMPEMPEAFIRHDEGWAGLVLVDVYTADQMRAMWLAGIAAARECVPDTDPFSGGADRDKDSQVTGQIHFRHAVLANLSALEQGVGK